MKKVYLVSSPGGHWVQLMRLKPAFINAKTIFSSTYSKPSEELDGNYYQLCDVNRKSFLKVVVNCYKVFKILSSEKPDLVVSTGALPGLITLFVARGIGIKTIWIDSIANADKLSMSGFVASYFCHQVYTQWPRLESSKVKYIGRVI